MVCRVSNHGISLTAHGISLGPDLLVVVTGGAAHIGSITAGTPHPGIRAPLLQSATVSTFSYPGHRDAEIGDRFAKVLCAKWGRKTVVICGIHYDEASPALIERILEQSDALLAQICRSDPDTWNTAGLSLSGPDSEEVKMPSK